MNNKIIDRFWNYISYEALTGCWIWTGAVLNDKKRKTQQPYGVFTIKRGQQVYAHRFSAMIHGLNMSGQVMRHLCNTPSCCNPLHLETGSHQDNANDRVKLVKSLTPPKPLKIQRSRGRPRTRPLPDPNIPKRSRGRPNTKV